MKFDNSLKLLDKALKVIPKGTQTLSRCYDQWAKGTVPIFIDRADGAYMYDVDGNEFVDLMGGLGPIILGYNHPIVNSAIQEQLDKGSIFSISSPLEAELAELLVEIIPCAEFVRFGKNGSDVTSIAVRISRAYTGKEHILSPTGHYHGWADFCAASSTKNKGLPESIKSLVDHFEYNDLDSLEAKLKIGKFGTVIMEPARLEAPNEGFLQGVRDLCTKHDAILIFDEIVTGFRWAIGGAQEYYGVVPDMATVGKAMSNGMPISALVGKKELMKELEGDVFFSGTYLGETLSIVSAIATINIMKDNRKAVFSHLWAKGDALRIAFNEHCDEIGLDAEMVGIGPLSNIKFGTSDQSGCKDLFCKLMAERGFFVGVAVYVTLAHSDEVIERAINAMKSSLFEVADALENRTIDTQLGGERSVSIFRKEI